MKLTGHTKILEAVALQGRYEVGMKSGQRL